MANTGKFMDRCPQIPAAGLKSNVVDISEFLKYTSLEEEVEATVSTFPKLPKKECSIPASTVNFNAGYFTQVQKLLSPPKKRIFQHLREELCETAFKSYWASELGKGKDQTPNLPIGLNPETTVFGTRTRYNQGDIENTVNDVVFPKKTYGEVELEYEIGLNLYKRSHHHYLPGEKKDYFYDAPDDIIFGKSEEYNKTGLGAKECLQFYPRSAGSSSDRLTKYKERTQFRLGEVLAPNKNINSVEEGHTFGIKTTSLYSTGTKEAMSFGPINTAKFIVGEFISYICRLRNNLKKRIPPFPFYELLANFKLLDQDLCIIHGENNDTVSYNAFCNLIDYAKPLPRLTKIDDLPDEWKFYETTYSALTKDHDKLKDFESIQKAGTPSLRLDKEEHMDEIGGVDSCIRPSIFTLYGLHPRDFLELKTKDYMKGLWKRVGVTISDDLFELMWKEALTRKENDAERDMVCIETFRNILDEVTSAKLIETQEA